MNIIKQLISKQNRQTTIKYLTYPIYWFIVFYGAMYIGALLMDYNTFVYES